MKSSNINLVGRFSLDDQPLDKILNLLLDIMKCKGSLDDLANKMWESGADMTFKDPDYLKAFLENNIIGPNFDIKMIGYGQDYVSVKIYSEALEFGFDFYMSKDCGMKFVAQIIAMQMHSKK